MLSVVTVVLWTTLALAELYAQEPPPLRTFSSIPACSTCSVEFRPHVSMSLPDDSLHVDLGTSVFRLRGGNFLLSRLGGSVVPAFMDSTGRFQRLIARHGTGPGEISAESQIALAPGDSIWVIDRMRKLIFSPDANFVREERLTIRGGLEPLVTAARTLITADRVQTPDAAGYPLQLRDASFNILKSFGTLDRTLDPRRLAATRDDPSIYLNRWLTPADSASFWAYNFSRFLLEKYDVDGRLMSRFRHALDGWYGDATRLNPSPGEFSGLALHAVQPSANPGLVWLVYHAPRPGYVKPQDGTSFVWEDWSADHDLVVEAFDSRRNEVLATGRIAQTMAFRIQYGADMLALVRPTTDGFVSLQVVTLHLSRPELR